MKANEKEFPVIVRLNAEQRDTLKLIAKAENRTMQRQAAEFIKAAIVLWASDGAKAPRT
jgi:hypothetical protein